MVEVHDDLNKRILCGMVTGLSENAARVVRCNVTTECNIAEPGPGVASPLAAHFDCCVAN